MDDAGRMPTLFRFASGMYDASGSTPAGVRVRWTQGARGGKSDNMWLWLTARVVRYRN